MEVAILVTIVALPIALIYLFKSSPSLAFISLCVGAVLQQYVSDDLAKKVDQLAPQLSNNNEFLAIWLIAIPLLLSILFSSKSVPGGKAFLLHFVPALCTGIVFALLVVPYLISYAYPDIITTPLWSQLRSVQALAVGIGALFSLPLIWTNKHRKHHHKDKHKK